MREQMISSFIKGFRTLLSIFIMLLVWAVLGMVTFERFIPPFKWLESWLMPWRFMHMVAGEESLSGSLRFMQGILDSSRTVAKGSLALMTVSFFILTVYATFVYQQRQRRARENELLMMKNREIARRNEFIRYISATIGHEFKNNLSNIKRRVDLMDLPVDQKSRLDDTLEKLFSDISIFKKISDEREGALVEFERVELRKMFERFAVRYEDLAEISIGHRGYEPVIFASRTLLETVFDIIIDNAVKYKKPEQERASIAISCLPDADGVRRYVSISIRDSGIGMNEQQAEGAFYKVTSPSGGWGEGLYFAKYAVGLHAGKIRVGKEYTEPGRGTEIIIKLPDVEETLHV
jgi:signal transduction histidine kinase